MDLYQNKILLDGNIALTIGSPYYGDDPSRWINILASNINAKEIEIIVIDDGTNDEALDNRIKQAIDNWPGPAKRIKLTENIGRAKARNTITNHAKGEYILFIDGDMIPKDDDFLDKYLKIVKSNSAAIVFGGFITISENISKDQKLHYDLSIHGDCMPAKDRAPRGAYAVASNNLLAQKKVFTIEPFDDNFKGWGWEDTEWSLRAVSKGFGLLHIDNPAIHWGLDSSKTMLEKYREAGENLSLMVKKHPNAKRFLGVKIAGIVGKIPFHSAFRPIAKFVTLDELGIFPIFIRRLAIKFWRASWAAQSLTENSKN